MSGIKDVTDDISFSRLVGEAIRRGKHLRIQGRPSKKLGPIVVMKLGVDCYLLQHNRGKFPICQVKKTFSINGEVI